MADPSPPDHAEQQPRTPRRLLERRPALTRDPDTGRPTRKVCAERQA
ncbi:hypothetical protein ACFVAF_04195 [Streptomyces sp. NPDC057596]